MTPGEWILSDEPIEINPGRPTCRLTVHNTGDRPIQVGSHFHFFEVNAALDFDRAQAMGMHLNIPGGMAVRFEPGDTRDVELVPFGGMRRVVGFNALVEGGVTSEATVRAALRRARERGFRGVGPEEAGKADEARHGDAKGRGKKTSHGKGKAHDGEPGRT